jgi:hypothetical protein
MFSFWGIGDQHASLVMGVAALRAGNEFLVLGTNSSA